MKALPKQKFPAKTAKLCRASGRVLFHEHCSERMTQRSVGRDDIANVLDGGVITEQRFKAKGVPPNCWWYRATGMVGRRKIGVVFYFTDFDGSPLMTIYTVTVNDQ